MQRYVKHIETGTTLLALLVLLLGLANAATALGVSPALADPIGKFGAVGLAWMLGIAVARLFTAIGLWVRASWGAALLLATGFFEMYLLFAGMLPFRIGFPGFFLRFILFLAALGLIGQMLLVRWRRVED